MRPLHVELGAPLLLPLVWLCPTSSFERKQSHTALPKWLRPSRTSSRVRPYLTPHLVLQQTLAALPPKYIHCLSPSHCHHPGPCCPISLLGKLFPDFAPHNSQDAILKMQTGSCALLHKTFPWGFDFYPHLSKLDFLLVAKGLVHVKTSVLTLREQNGIRDREYS